MGSHLDQATRGASQPSRSQHTWYQRSPAMGACCRGRGSADRSVCASCTKRWRMQERGLLPRAWPPAPRTHAPALPLTWRDPQQQRSPVTSPAACQGCQGCLEAD
eukprot:15468745-Alexandrium_andersonii.AAC.1